MDFQLRFLYVKAFYVRSFAIKIALKVDMINVLE